MPSDTLISVEQEIQYRSWAKDPEKFFREAIKITDPKGRVVPLDFTNRPYQSDCLRRFLSSPICAVLKARQIGLTTLACALALWLLLFHENRVVTVLSRNDREAKKFLRRIKAMYERLPSWVKLRGPDIIGRWGKHEAEFANGSSIWSATSSSDPARGDTPTDIFLDEVGFMRNQEDSWSALYPAVEEGGTLRVFGTAKGARDWFHLKWLDWESDDDVDTIFYGWDSIPGRDEAWAARTRRRLGEAKFKREYPRTAAEAFQTSGSMVFSLEVLDEVTAAEGNCVSLVRRPDGTFTLEPAALDDSGFGLFVFEEPEPGARYLTSADPAEGLVDSEESDPSAIQVLRWGDGSIRQVAVYRNKIDPEGLADVDHALSIFYNRATVIVERNNHGNTMLKRLSRLRTPNVVRGGAGRMGLWTSKASKATNIALTRTALADRRLELFDEWTIDELYQFQERTLPSGGKVYEGSEHDDHVDALCMGVGYAVVHAPWEQPVDDEPPEEEEPPHPYSFDSLMRGRRLTGARHM